MAELIPPGPRVRASFREAHAELAAAPGLTTAEAASWMQLATVAGAPDHASIADDAAFAEFCRRLRGQAAEVAAAPEQKEHRPEGWVPDTILWWVDGTRWIGRLSIRHRLTPFLLEVGGHVGYVVRPRERGRGHATAMLVAALPVAAGLGLDRVLVTCDHDNHASRRVIEKAGGRLEDQRGVKLRYWVATAPR